MLLREDGLRVRVRASQRWTALPRPPEANRLPSGENATHRTYSPVTSRIRGLLSWPVFQSYRPVGPARRDRRPVGRECDGVDRAAVPRMFVDGARSAVPDPQDPVAAGGRHRAAVGGEVQRQRARPGCATRAAAAGCCGRRPTTPRPRERSGVRADRAPRGLLVGRPGLEPPPRRRVSIGPKNQTLGDLLLGPQPLLDGQAFVRDRDCAGGDRHVTLRLGARLSSRPRARRGSGRRPRRRSGSAAARRLLGFAGTTAMTGGPRRGSRRPWGGRRCTPEDRPPSRRRCLNGLVGRPPGPWRRPPRPNAVPRGGGTTTHRPARAERS